MPVSDTIQSDCSAKATEETKSLVEACLDDLATITALLGEVNQRTDQIYGLLWGKR